MAGTREDAQMMVELAKWGAMINLQDATRALFADDFDPEAVDAMNPAVQTVLIFMETIGTLVKNDLLDRELVHDWLWVQGMWERTAPAARKAREKAGEPRLYENFEALAG